MREKARGRSFPQHKVEAAGCYSRLDKTVVVHLVLFLVLSPLLQQPLVNSNSARRQAWCQHVCVNINFDVIIIINENVIILPNSFLWVFCN